jgi:hypothetical protein
MTPKRPKQSEYERKLARLDPETQRLIRQAVSDIEDEPQLSRLRRRTTRGTLLDFGAQDAGYAIEITTSGVPIDLHDTRFPIPN